MAFSFMKDSRIASTVCLIFLAISILFSCAAAESSEYSTIDATDPRRNDNLSVVQQWRSAVECMWNFSMNCTAQQQLSLNLTLEVAKEDVAAYCEEGCLDHTMYVLECIDAVKRDFWFANNFDTWTLRRFLADRCATLSGFSYKEVPSGAIKVSQKMALSMVLPLVASLYILANSNSNSNINM